ncbi:MAG: hypothetical protein JJU13_02820 [Balneolaceae bacterium]|nr:hypothetical protein [Balneolaceae bacterium]
METEKIRKNIRTNDDRDFEFLRSEGLKYIENLSRKVWTDYNSHDPGITILEALCYAITDLGNRIRLPVRDLIAESKGDTSTALPPAKQILTTAPVSEADYRKLFIDIDGVKNAFIRPDEDHTVYTQCLQKEESEEAYSRGKLSYEKNLGEHYKKTDQFTLKGLNRILFEPDLSIQMMDEPKKEEKIDRITEEIRKKYHANRNLCEDLADISEAETVDILVCGDIEIESNANASAVLSEFFFRIQQYLSPPVNRYSLNELLDKGKPVEKIFEGPVLQNGFILDEELEQANFRDTIHLSDLIRIAKETPGIKTIRHLRMKQCLDKENPDGCSETKEHNNEWTICFPPGHDKTLRLKLAPSIQRTNLFKDVVPMYVDADTVKEELLQKQLDAENELQPGYDDLSIEKGTPLQTGRYQTVQNDLPALYGTGPNGLSSKLPPERHSKALQLKGYLLFFDQILATYFSHLREIGQLLSPSGADSTYFHNRVDNVRDFEKLVDNLTGYDDDVKEALAKLDSFEERKNLFLDHLLSRFAEQVNDYAFMLLDDRDDLHSERLWHKTAILKEYPAISYRRFQSFDLYCDDCESWETENVAGLKHRLARLLGIRDIQRKNLTNYRFEFAEDESGDGWSWHLKNDEDKILLKSIGLSESRTQAHDTFWNAIRLSDDPANYIIEQDGETYTVILQNRNGDPAAKLNNQYADELDAETEIKSVASWMREKQLEEGMFLFENILLRPDPDDNDADKKFMKICMSSECSQCPPNDPYSFRLTIVLPGWLKRFSNMYYREFAENVIRSEVPAHILTRICWIGYGSDEETERPQMAQLDELYKNWLTHKMSHPDKPHENEHLKPLADVLHDLQTIYPQGRLHDCQDDEEQHTSIILGRSTIGEIKEEKNNDE